MTIRPKHLSRRRAFALVLTLIALSVVVAVLSVATLKYQRQARATERAVQDLQLRAAAQSCERTILPVAEALITAREQKTGRGIPLILLAGTLGASKVTVAIADEQAKINLNTLYLDRGEQFCVTLLSDLLDQGAGQALKISLRALPVDPTVQGARPFSGFGQVVSPCLPPVREQVALAHPFDMITLWGDGALNVRRATDPCVRAKLGGHFSKVQIDRLLNARLRSPFLSAKDAMRALQGSDQSPSRQKGLLTDSSASYSIHVISRGERGAFHRLVVTEESTRKMEGSKHLPDRTQTTRAFEW